MHLSYHLIMMMMPAVVFIGDCNWQLNTDCVRYLRLLFLTNAILIAKVIIEKQNKPDYLVLLFSLCLVLPTLISLCVDHLCLQLQSSVPYLSCGKFCSASILQLGPEKSVGLFQEVFSPHHFEEGLENISWFCLRALVVYVCCIQELD